QAFRSIGTSRSSDGCVADGADRRGALRSAMMTFILRKLASTLVVMLVVAVIVFLLIHLSPGDPAAVIAGERASSEDIEVIRRSLGLDEPLAYQFALWLGRLLHGDFGISLFTRLPVIDLVGQRIEPTLALALVTMLFAIATALPLGVLAAWKVGTLIDRAIMAVATIAFSFPI